jgi:hypothetical protein
MWSPSVRIIQACLVAIFLLTSAQGFAQTQHPHGYTGRFQRWHDFRQEFKTHCHRVNAWPHPFLLEDREMVRTPFRTMADNGWKLQNTLSDHLFTPEENELTYAGQLKLRWILTQIPPHRRQIYVVEAHVREDTANRVASVYEHLATIAPHAACPVFVTQIAPRGGDGSYLNDMDRAYKLALPAPSLPAVSSGSDPGEATSGG